MVQNGPRGGPGRLGDWLTRDGATLDVVHAYRDDPLPERLTHDALVVLGGAYLPDEDERAPWLAATRALTAQALRQGRPYFGICLGGQLLAQVAGGTVRGEHGTPEFGSTALSLRAEAADDPLFQGLPPRVTAIERHVDAITALPPDAHWLVENDSCPYQAFRVGDAAWGVQFHPEVTAERVRDWDPAPLRARGFDPDELHRRAVADDATAERVWREVARRFAGVVTG